jgi:hypothetical protein
VVTPERLGEVRDVVALVSGWAAGQAEVRGVLLVGSWARGAARPDSDVDLVVLTGDAAHAGTAVWARLLGGRLVRRRRWGPLQEIRLRRPSGLVVDVGVVPVSWADTDPVDPGTRRVVRDGHRVVHDPGGILAALVDACR